MISTVRIAATIAAADQQVHGEARQSLRGSEAAPDPVRERL